jgi:hypothetical protein
MAANPVYSPVGVESLLVLPCNPVRCQERLRQTDRPGSFDL